MVWTYFRCREYYEEVARIHRRMIKKDLHDPDNHNGVITHLHPDILECEVKWALGSTTTNKASGGDGMPVELFNFSRLSTSQGYYSAWFFSEIQKRVMACAQDTFRACLQEQGLAEELIPICGYRKISGEPFPEQLWGSHGMVKITPSTMPRTVL